MKTKSGLKFTIYVTQWGLSALLSLLLLQYCQREIFLENGYPSLPALSEALAQAAAANSEEGWQQVFISVTEFRNLIYPHLPEASGPGKIEADDYWGWTIPDVLKSKKKLFQTLKGAQILAVEAGEPQKILRQGKYKIWRDIPLKIKYKSSSTDKEQYLESRQILKAVIEARGQFKLWNSAFEG